MEFNKILFKIYFELLNINIKGEKWIGGRP